MNEECSSAYSSSAVLVEISHASASDQAQFSRKYFAKLRNLKYVIMEMLMCIASLSCITVLILAWLIEIPVLSSNLVNHSRFSIPISVTCTITLSVLFVVCLWRILDVVSCCGLIRKRRDPGDVDNCQEHTPTSKLSSRGKQPQHVLKKFARLNDLSENAILSIKDIAQNYLSNRCSFDSQLFLSAPNIHATDKSLTDSVKTDDSDEFQMYDLSAKIALLGPTNAGKTSIFHRLLYNCFSERYVSTLGVDIGFTTLSLYSKERHVQLNIGLQIWDLAGSESSQDVSGIAFKDVLAFILVYDTSDIDSYNSCQYWLQDIKCKRYDPYIVLFGNKIDKESEILSNHKLTEDSMLETFHVSARNGEGVSNSFIDAVAKSLIHEADKLM